MGAPITPYGTSNWPRIDCGAGAQGCMPTRDRPDSPCVTRTVEQWPAAMAAAACRTCSMKEEPPTCVPSR